ncbi:MAG: VOC family protein, partial [Bacteroidota bacterium]
MDRSFNPKIPICMKVITVNFLLICCLTTSFGQSSSKQKISLRAFAVIVEDIDTSISWYKSVLGFSVLNRKELRARGIKMANLESEGMYLELIEWESAISPKEQIP